MDNFNEQIPIWLAHHGIDGQKWGVRHGPPYPLKKSDARRIKKSADRVAKFTQTKEDREINRNYRKTLTRKERKTEYKEGAVLAKTALKDEKLKKEIEKFVNSYDGSAFLQRQVLDGVGVRTFGTLTDVEVGFWRQVAKEVKPHVYRTIINPTKLVDPSDGEQEMINRAAREYLRENGSAWLY